MKFRKLIARAWKLTTKHKVLWLFAALPFLTNLPGILFVVAGRTTVSQGEFYALRCLSSIISLTMLPISTAGLIKGFQKANAGKRIRFQPLFKEARHYFWRLFLLPFLLGLIIFPIYIGVLLFRSIASSGADFLICLVPLILLAIPIVFIIVVGYLFIDIAIVVEDVSIGEAINSAARMIQANLKKILWMFLGYSGLNLPVTYGLAFLYSFTVSSINSELSGILRPVSFILIAAIYYLAISFLSAFYQGLWVVSYVQLKKTKAAKKKKGV